MSLWTSIRTRSRQQWRKLRDAGVRKVIADATKRLLEYFIKLIAWLGLAAVVSLVAVYLPTNWQSRIVVAMITLGVPGELLPSDPKGKYAEIGINSMGFGYANHLFADATQESASVLLFDRQSLSNVVVCHPWKGAGGSRQDVLQSFVGQHPDCFEIASRKGGGVEIKPKVGATAKGDFITGPDQKTRAFACECRGLLEQVQKGLDSGC